MAPKKISVALYDRATKEPRSFHWGILIWPEESVETRIQVRCDAYHATDRSGLNTETFRMINPAGAWWFEDKIGVNPDQSKKFEGCIVIGTVPRGIQQSEVTHYFASVPLPIKHQYPQQTCRTWVKNAILGLQEKGWAWHFDVDEFIEWGLDYAEERKAKKGRERMEEYPNGKK